MDVDDERPFSLEGNYESFGEAFPSVATLSVTIRSLDLVHDTVEMREYGERDVPSHVDCPNCGHETAVGWALADLVYRGETAVRETLQCGGLEQVGRSCPYGYDLEGTIVYEGE